MPWSSWPPQVIHRCWLNSASNIYLTAVHIHHYPPPTVTDVHVCVVGRTGGEAASEHTLSVDVVAVAKRQLCPSSTWSLTEGTTQTAQKGTARRQMSCRKCTIIVRLSHWPLLHVSCFYRINVSKPFIQLFYWLKFTHFHYIFKHLVFVLNKSSKTVNRFHEVRLIVMN